MKQTIRDRSNRAIATLEDRAGRTELREISGQSIGYYDHRTDTTREPCGRLVGHGDQLMRLL